MRTRVALFMLGVIAFAPAAAQRQPGRGRGNVAQQLAPDGDTSRRAQLETEFRQRFARLARTRVGLSDDQVSRLVPLTQKHEAQRRRLQIEERDTRVALREQMRRAQPDTAVVARLLTQLVDVQKRRTAMFESEQRDLASVMTPVQRARFMALQEQIRRSLEQMRQRRTPLFEGDGPIGPPPRRPPR